MSVGRSVSQSVSLAALFIHAPLCTWWPQVNLNTGGVRSDANVTDIHVGLNFDMVAAADGSVRSRQHDFGIFSLRWSSDGAEIIAGTNDSSLCVFDMEQQRVCAM
jgi:DDB1- and CUL4-associated factor 11